MANNPVGGLFSNLSAGQTYALLALLISGAIVCVLGLYSTIVFVATGHDSKELTVLLRFVVGLFGASGATSAVAMIRHIKDTNGSS